MVLPDSSFFKLHLLLIVLGLLVVFSFLGSVKDVFAEGWPGECHFIYENIYATGTSFNTWQDCIGTGEVIYNDETGEFSREYECGYKYQECTFYIGTIKSVYYENREWHDQGYYLNNQSRWLVNDPRGVGRNSYASSCCDLTRQQIIEECGGEENVDWDEIECDGTCTCQEARQALEQECDGPDKYFIDGETCEGHCLPDDDCTDEYNAKIVECGLVQDIIKWSNETCEGLCSYVPQNAGPPDRCENYQ